MTILGMPDWLFQSSFLLWDGLEPALIIMAVIVFKRLLKAIDKMNKTLEKLEKERQ